MLLLLLLLFIIFDIITGTHAMLLLLWFFFCLFVSYPLFHRIPFSPLPILGHSFYSFSFFHVTIHMDHFTLACNLWVCVWVSFISLSHLYFLFLFYTFLIVFTRKGKGQKPTEEKKHERISKIKKRQTIHFWNLWIRIKMHVGIVIDNGEWEGEKDEQMEQWVEMERIKV